MKLDGDWSAKLHFFGNGASPAGVLAIEGTSALVPLSDDAQDAGPPQSRRLPFPVNPEFRRWFWLIAELALIAIWAIVVAKPLLNFDEHLMPAGGEYWVNVTANTFWDRLQTCGQCALWNGTTRGGYPAIADMQAAFLHPIVAIPALLFGWVNGAKVTVAAALFLAGFAQWWLARVLGLGRAARLWSGCLGAAAGSMAGRMEDGAVILMVCGASCALIIPPFIQLARDGRLRTAAILGVTIGLALVSGQAYLQVALAGIAPISLLVLLYRTPLGRGLMVRRFAFAGGIGLLIAAPLLVPFLHVLPHYTKDVDPSFGLAQPLAFIPLNLVIDDPEYFHQDVLGKAPFPYIYTSYIGWLAVFMVIAGIVALWIRRDFRLLVGLSIMVFLPFWLASGQPLIWLANILEGSRTLHEFVIGLRSVPLFAGLAIPPLLGFAAIGLDWLWRSLPHAFRIMVERRESLPKIRIDPRWLLVVLLLLATNQARDFGQRWMYLIPDGSVEMGPVLDALETDDLQWVNTPYGTQQWWGPAIQRGMKLAINPASWTWDSRILPVPVLVADNVPLASGDYTAAQVIGGFTIYTAAPGSEYAAIVHADGTRTVCTAKGLGGSIDVTCNASQPGRLVVMEHMTNGWTADVGGQEKNVSKSDEWVSVDVPAGETTIRLRYQPWDVPVGLALMVVGLIMAGGAAFWYDRRSMELPSEGHMAVPLPNGDPIPR